MRTTHRCPKCAHGEVISLPRLTDSNMTEMAVHHESSRSGRLSWWGSLEAVVCAKCGYTELYTRDPASIPLDKIAGAVRLVAKSDGPYR